MVNKAGTRRQEPEGRKQKAESRRQKAQSSSDVLPAAYCLLPTAFCFLPTAFCRSLLPSRDPRETDDPPRAFGYGNVVFILEIAVGKQA